jgi:arsenite methyltransferase
MKDAKVNEKGEEQAIKDAVREHYGAIARSVSETPAAAGACCGSTRNAGCGCGCGSTTAPTETGFAGIYSPEELSGLPATVTEASLGCGNPIAISELNAGEVVLDLGSGGGIDCFLAAQRVGPTGRVIGLDMTTEMIKLARRNAKKMDIKNVEFRWGEMEEMPLEDESVDVVISNCVINLSPDKGRVFSEAYRVLRPGGRLRVSDMVLRRELPPGIRGQLDAWASCVSGALLKSDYLGKMRAAGFQDVQIVSDVPVKVTEFPEFEQMRQALSAAGIDAQLADDTVASISVSACKPA